LFLGYVCSLEFNKFFDSTQINCDEPEAYTTVKFHLDRRLRFQFVMAMLHNCREGRYIKHDSSNSAGEHNVTPSESTRVLADVDAFCQEIRSVEELCYVEHAFNAQVIPLAKKHGILGMPVPVEYGGRGCDTVTYARALARIGREGTGVRTFFSGHTSIGQYPIMTWGNEEQKKRYLPASVQGQKIMAFALTEPDAGSNPLEMTMQYRREGDQFSLTGVKYLISNAGIATTAICFAYPQGRQGRISAFIVDIDGPGCAKENLTAKMGMPTANTGMFELTDYKVPLGNLLGEEGEGFRIAMGTLVSGRISVAAGCLGVIEDCLEEAVQYAKTREQHGKPIGKHQLVQEHLAMIEMDRLASDALVMQAATAKDASQTTPTDTALKAKAELLAAQAKLFAANAAWDAADRAVQVFGGRGWSTLYRPGRHLQDVRVCRIYEGTDEILKLKVAAALLGREYEAYK
jgi:alkylation response protein AidB-like acyl-CoA dehydrogenase